MATNSLPLVLIFGGTGKTAASIITALLESRSFRVAATVRASSLDKPVVAEYRNRGVDIREADLDDGVEKLAAMLSGVDVLISTVFALKVLDQRDLFTAAKRAGVKRAIPCDFGTPGAKGVRRLHDQKLEIREHVKSLGLGYTFIDIGFYYQLSLPVPLDQNPRGAERSREIYDGGSKKTLVTNSDNIGKHVTKIIADDRTLNHAVIVWEDVTTGLQAKEIGARVSGDERLLTDAPRVSAEALLERVNNLRQEHARTGDINALGLSYAFEYMYSFHVLGENTLENAKALGYLDFRELYPDVTPQTLEEWAPTFYRQ